VIAWWKRGRITRDDLLPLAPLFLLGVALGLLTVWMETHHVGAQGEEWKLSAVERLLIAGRALWFYAAKLAWPSPLVFFYPRWTIDPSQAWQYLFPAAAIGVMLALWMARTRLGRGPLAAVLIFAGVLVPAIGFFNVYPFRFSFVADHFQYHASIALIALASAALASAVARFRIPAIAAKITVGVLLVALGAVTIRQTLVYRNLETLYLHVLAHNPESWISCANLAGYLNSLGRRAEAIELNRRALDLAPREAVLHHNMAAVLIEKGKRDGYETGQLEEAIAQHQAALELSPGLVISHAGLAEALIEANQLDQARQQLRIANKLNASHPSVQLQWGNLCEHDLDLRRAEQHYQAAARQSPDDPEPWAKLGNVLLKQGRFDQAVTSFNRALKLDPNYPGTLARREQALKARTKSTR
jgi:tetratricopeptide (TPR) repeat protein